MPGKSDGTAAAPEVLVIDDDPALLHSLITALGAFGIPIATARDGRAGLKVFRKIAPKVVITDIIMPEQDGIAVIMAMRRERPDVKMIAMSGGGRLGKSDFLTIARKLGADATIAKPFEVDKLVALIRALQAADEPVAESEFTVLPLAAMDAPHMIAALSRWREARTQRAEGAPEPADGAMPSEQQAAPLELSEAVSRTGLVDVLQDPLDFRIRYSGADAAKAYGDDYTGRRFSELGPQRYVERITEAYGAVAVARLPLLHRVHWRKDQRSLDYSRLLMPLSNDGRVVDTIWAVTHFDRAS
jgi:CheY-like chemotaxis protein